MAPTSIKCSHEIPVSPELAHELLVLKEDRHALVFQEASQVPTTAATLCQAALPTHILFHALL